jgi:hypothetical protein
VPGKCHRFSGQLVAQGLVGERERPGELINLDLPALDDLSAFPFDLNREV